AWGAGAQGAPTSPLISTLHALQAAASASSATRCFIVTRGAVSIGPEDAPTSPIGAAIGGLGRTFSLEHPDLWGGLIDLPSAELEPVRADLLSFFAKDGAEDQIALRASSERGARWVQRLVPLALPAAPSAKFTAQGTVLITGGLGALGL